MNCHRKWARHPGRKPATTAPPSPVSNSASSVWSCGRRRSTKRESSVGRRANWIRWQYAKSMTVQSGEQLTALWEQPKMFLVQKEALKGQFRAIFLPERGLGDQNKKRTLRWACEEMWNHGSPDCQATTNRGRFGLVVKKNLSNRKKRRLFDATNPPLSGEFTQHFLLKTVKRHSGLLLSPRAWNGQSRDAASRLPRQWRGRVWSRQVGWHKRLNKENALWCPAVRLYLGKSPKSPAEISLQSANIHKLQINITLPI